MSTEEEFSQRIKQERIQLAASWGIHVAGTIGVPATVASLKVIFTYDDGSTIEMEIQRK